MHLLTPLRPIDPEIQDIDKEGLSVPDLSLQIQKSIFKASEKIEKKDQILKEVEKEYKTIST